MKNKFTKTDVIIENGKNGVQPAIFLIENGKVFMITITPDHQFQITEEGAIGERYNELGQWCGKEEVSENE